MRWSLTKPDEPVEALSQDFVEEQVQRNVALAKLEDLIENLNLLICDHSSCRMPIHARTRSISLSRNTFPEVDLQKYISGNISLEI